MLGQTLLQNSETRSICVLRLSAIGDVCHAISMVQAIQKQRPDIRITWIVGKVEAQLLKGMSGVDFIVFDKRAGIKGLLELRRSLRGQSFDVLFHMQVAIRASIVSRFVKAKVRLGFDAQRAKEGQWIFTNQKISQQKHPHVLEGFAAFGEAIGIEVLPPSWDMPIDQEEEKDVLSTFPVNAASFAVISPVASNDERNWTVEGYAKIADYLRSKGLDVVLTASPSEKDLAFVERIVDQCSEPVCNLAGKTNLKKLLVVLKHAKLVIAPDSGPAHMAVSVETPVVGLYAHSNPRRTGPYLYRQYVVNHYDECIQKQRHKSWEDLPWGVRAKGADLMSAITENEVKEKIDKVFEDFYSNE